MPGENRNINANNSLRFKREVYVDRLSALWGGCGTRLASSIGVAAGGISHSLQIFLNFGWYAGVVIELLIGNPAEVLQTEIELLRIKLGVIHREAQGHVILRIAMKALLNVCIDSVRITILRSPGAVFEAGRIYNKCVVIFPM